VVFREVFMTRVLSAGLAWFAAGQSLRGFRVIATPWILNAPASHRADRAGPWAS